MQFSPSFLDAIDKLEKQVSHITKAILKSKQLESLRVMISRAVYDSTPPGYRFW